MPLHCKYQMFSYLQQQNWFIYAHQSQNATSVHLLKGQ